MARPPRLAACKYNGIATVSFTISAYQRATVFTDKVTSAHVIEQLLRCAEKFDVEILAHCLMPEHGHVLAKGLSEQAELRTMLVRWKQLTGYWFRRRTGGLLWQPGYWDRVLREDDDVRKAAQYVIDNPVRAGIVVRAADYAWVGSSRWSIEELSCTRRAGL